MHIETAKRAFNGFRDTPQGDLLRAAVNYAHLRAEWFLAAPGQRVNMDQRRTAAHNAFIDSCNILSRQMAKAGDPTEWRDLLGSDRREVEDFACCVTLFLGLSAR